MFFVVGGFLFANMSHLQESSEVGAGRCDKIIGQPFEGTYYGIDLFPFLPHCA